MREPGERLYVTIRTQTGEIIWTGSVDARDVVISEPVPHISHSSLSEARIMLPAEAIGPVVQHIV